MNLPTCTISMARRWFAVGLLVLTAVAARADVVRVAHIAYPSHVVLTVNNVPVAGLVAGPVLSGQERAGYVEARLSSIANGGRAPRFTVGKADGTFAVMVNGGVVVAPNRGDVLRAGIPARQLAHQWAARLQSAWSTPFLRLSPGGLVVGVGMARTIRVNGAARGPIQVSTEGSPHASVREVRPGVVEITGLTPGRGMVTVTRDGATATSAYLILKPAGSVRPISVDVTGTAIPDDLLEAAVDTEVRRAIRLEPGAWFTMKSRPTFPAVWTRGASLRYHVPVRLAGPNYLSVQRSLDIRIRRRSVSKPRSITLFYSNDPETIRGPQMLFQHALPDDSGTRFLYHHQNKGAKALTLAVDITNDGDTDVPVQIVDGTVAPDVDTVLVGHRAAYKFLKRLQTGTGLIVRVPAKGHRRLFARRLASNDTLSGLMLLRPLADGHNGHLVLSMRAEEEGHPTGPEALSAPTEAVFPSPDKTIDVSYTVGGAWTYVPIGRYPVSNDAGKTLYGNYGVLYTVRMHLENPTAKAATVRVLFEARAGRAQAAIIVNGTLTETPSIYPPAEVRVMTVPLAPHETKTVTLVTMPAAGGSYPASLIVRA